MDWVLGALPWILDQHSRKSSEKSHAKGKFVSHRADVLESVLLSGCLPRICLDAPDEPPISAGEPV